MRALTDPAGTEFRFLKLAGTLLIYLGLLMVALVLLGSLLSLLPDVRLPVLRMLPLVALFYAIPVIVAGHLLHWTVAVWESREKTTALLAKLTRKGGNV